MKPNNKITKNRMMAAMYVLSIILFGSFAHAQVTQKTPTAENSDDSAAEKESDDQGSPSMVEPSPEKTLDACKDSVDNDKDSYVDCDDQDCLIFAMCIKPQDSDSPSNKAADGRSDKAKSKEEPKIEEDIAPKHEGLFFRGAFGVGAGGYHVSGNTESLDIEPDARLNLKEFRTSIGFALSLGGAVKKNFILHGELTGIGVMDPDNDPAHPGMDIFGFGVGMTYYFMPYNFYITGSMGFAVPILQDGDHHRANPAPGVIGKFTVGKEWYVNSKWGLGFAGQANYTYGRRNSVDFHQGAFLAFFSATYN